MKTKMYFVEYVIIFLFKFYIKQYLDKFPELKKDDIFNFLEGRELNIFYCYREKSPFNYFTQLKFKEIYNNNEDLNEILYNYIKLFDSRVNNSIANGIILSFIKEFLRYNNISVSELKSSFSYYFSKLIIYEEVEKDVLSLQLDKRIKHLEFSSYIYKRKNIFKYNFKNISNILLGFIWIVFFNENLIEYYMRISIKYYYVNLVNHDRLLEQSPIFRAINHLKQINFIKSYSNRRNLVLYTFNKININNNQYTLKLYQHDFILAWFANYTSIHEFDVFLNGQRRTIDKINSSLTSNGMKLIKTKSFKSTIINFTENNTLNLSIYKYLSKLK